AEDGIRDFHVTGVQTCALPIFTLPLLSNTLAFVLIFALIAALQAFDQIYVMTGGGPYGHTQTIVMEIYQSGFHKLNLGFASALRSEERRVGKACGGRGSPTRDK